jgi:hypothetical protein
MQLTLHDLLWATFVTGVLLAWWTDHRSIDERRIEAAMQAQRQRVALQNAKMYYDFADPLILRMVNRTPRDSSVVREHMDVDFRVLDEPPIQP